VDTFYSFLMHASYTADALSRDLWPVVYRAQRALKCAEALGVEPPVFCAFLDEINTTSVLGMVSDLFLDGALPLSEGARVVGSATSLEVRLPRNIFWVGAANPYSDARADGSEDEENLSRSSSYKAGYQVCIWA
jgi:hypothetical protein